MRIAIVGPTHPYKGGIAQQNTELARQLTTAGHSVEIISWKAQYPFFYPGQQFVDADKPEIPEFSPVRRKLSWKNPLSWLSEGRHLRSFDHVIFVWWVPTIQGPIYLTMRKMLGKHGPKTTLICHNVLPHESKPGDAQLTRRILKKMDRIITHTQAQANLAFTLGAPASSVQIVDLPPILPPASPAKPYTLQNQLLFFGFVRTYKGLDVLIKALAEVPKIRLTVAGEFWKAEEYEDLIKKLRLQDRITLHKGYVPTELLDELFHESDALVLPYRGGTATYNATMAHNYGRPVIATTASSLASQVHDGVDGLLCKPDDVASLAAAIRHFYEPGVAKMLAANIENPAVAAAKKWQTYVDFAV